MVGQNLAKQHFIDFGNEQGPSTRADIDRPKRKLEMKAPREGIYP